MKSILLGGGWVHKSFAKVGDRGYLLSNAGFLPAYHLNFGLIDQVLEIMHLSDCSCLYQLLNFMVNLCSLGNSN